MNNMEKTLTFDTKTDLVIHVQSENLGVAFVGGEEETTQLIVKVDYSGDEETIELDEIIETNYNQETNELNIELHDLPKSRIYAWRCELRVPYVCEVRAQTENGPVSLKNLHGIQEVQSENAPVKLEAIEGTLHIETENGPVSILDVTGDAIVQTENGPIKVKQLNGLLKIETENGPVKLVKCEGNLQLKVENGVVRILQSSFETASVRGENSGIYYEFAPILSGTCAIENENGKITLVIPEELEFNLKALNRHGKIHVALDGDYEQINEDGYKGIEMVRGAAKVDVDAKNMHGSIVITNKKLGSSQGINIPNISEIFDSVIHEIPDESTRLKVEEKVKKAQEQLKKAQDQLTKIKMADVEAVVNDALNGIKTEVTTVIHDLSSDEFKKKAETTINSSITRVVDAVKNVVKDRPVSDSLKREVDERSRLKILELLENGKITADEAERLLKAMEQNDEG